MNTDVILRNSPIPKSGHLRDSESADTIGAQLSKLPHRAALAATKAPATAGGDRRNRCPTEKIVAAREDIKFL
jgi:hypothetical protein